ALKVHCELAPMAGAGAADDARRKLAQQVKDNFGISVEPVIHEAGAVARSEGKAKRVVDSR
ncbi:MAG: phenylacetate--CoA ligase, partial [Hyphomicrobiales bacterium]|nr:phenylacetate--CoA ligase [Hyphomicrobiales bacterium]